MHKAPVYLYKEPKTGSFFIVYKIARLEVIKMKRGNTKLINASTGEMECLKCGKSWWANLLPGGRYKRGSWVCSHCSDK